MVRAKARAKLAIVRITWIEVDGMEEVGVALLRFGLGGHGLSPQIAGSASVAFFSSFHAYITHPVSLRLINRSTYVAAT